MKFLITFAILISFVGCAPGLRARSSNSRASMDSDPNTQIDAFEIDNNVDDSTSSPKKPQQLEFDFGQSQNQSQPPKKEEQLELPLDKPIQNLDQKNADLSAPALLKPTIYYLPTNDVAPFKSCKENDIKAFRAMNGKELVPGKTEILVCSKFYFEVEMEGSGIVKLKDGREFLINYVGMQSDEPRFQVVDRSTCPYGLGKMNLCLQPFISVAADPNHYNVGDVIFVPAVAKAKIILPDGDVHRGYFIVADGGGAINGVGRFDFYTGPLDVNAQNPLQQVGLHSKSNTTHLVYQLVKRGSATEKAVRDYYKDRQIIPYK